LDGTKVTMVAEWRSIADYQAMRADPTPRPYLERALAMAKFEPGMYEVAETFCSTLVRRSRPVAWMNRLFAIDG